MPGLDVARGLPESFLNQQAMLAWLAERRVREHHRPDACARQRMDSLRLRAMVALTIWEGLSPKDLAAWQMADFAALAWDARAAAWTTWHDLFIWMPARMAEGPKPVVMDWVRAAGISSGNVFRRLSPQGAVTGRPLDGVGIASLLDGLIREKTTMGIIDRQSGRDAPCRMPATRPLRGQCGGQVAAEAPHV